MSAIPLLVIIPKDKEECIDDQVEMTIKILEDEFAARDRKVNIIARTPWEGVLPKHFLEEVGGIELFAALYDQEHPKDEPELDWPDFNDQEMDTIHKLFAVLADKVEMTRAKIKAQFNTGS